MEGVGGGEVVVRYFDSRKPLIVNGVTHHDAVTQTFPVSVILLRPGRKREFQSVMLRSGRGGLAAGKGPPPRRPRPGGGAPWGGRARLRVFHLTFFFFFICPPHPTIKFFI